MHENLPSKLTPEMTHIIYDEAHVSALLLRGSIMFFGMHYGPTPETLLWFMGLLVGQCVNSSEDVRGKASHVANLNSLPHCSTSNQTPRQSK